MTEPFNVIILAGGSGGPLAEATGVEEKAMLPIHGKPMLDRVVDAFHDSPEVSQIVVVGSDRLDDLACMEKVRKRMPPGMSAVQNLLHAVGYIKTRLYKGATGHQGYIVSFCDAVFLTEKIISKTLLTIRETDADIVLHYVERQTFQEAGLPTKRTYIPIGGSDYTGTTIYYVRAFSKVLASLDKLAAMRKNRKDPQGILRVVGCEGEDFPAIEQALSRHLDARVRILVSPHPELGMDVDKPSDFELASSLLPHQ